MSQKDSQKSLDMLLYLQDINWDNLFDTLGNLNYL